MSLETCDISEVYDLLYRLGITAEYTGFFHTSYAIYLAVLHPNRLLLVTKLLYPAVAKHYETSWQRVERNIRTVVSIAWNYNRALLIELAHHPLFEKPTASRFIAILSSSFRNQPPGCVSRSLSLKKISMTVVGQPVNQCVCSMDASKDGVSL